MAADITAIMTKVRRLTRTPSINQLSDADLLEYINTFTVYDFPEQLRTFNLRQTFSWTCNPFQDEYPTDIVAGADNQLNNFKNLYISVHPPLYIAGFQQMYTQSREQFFGIYPQVRSIQQIGIGDGVTRQFTGVINANQAILSPGQVTPNTLLQNKILFSSFDSNGNSLAMVDVALVNVFTYQFLPNGNLYVSGQQPTIPPLLPTVIDPTNTVNYTNGQFTVTFATAPGAGVPINSQSVPSPVGIPQALLYYDNMFTLRPVPDQPYTINFEVYIRPYSLTHAAPFDTPELEEYWQLISYGASRKIFQDRMDLDSVALIEPEFREQMRLCNRRNIVQYTNERTATIYTEANNTGWGIGSNGWGGGNGL